ncbi:NAD(P)H-dependent oxidoreductase [Streptomyces sp. NPDC050287]|uniref:NAD(P)H-dependent oxidoreductase n=1 Tax=Streptomyces sp. NPDC050287 TaxID=3365608 RepID=UPI0037A26794
MSTAAWSPVSLAVLCAGVGYGHPTRLLADWVAEAVCRSLAAGGARAEVEVLELHRLAVDLAQHSAHDRVSLDLREAIAAVAAADGLVVATPVLAASLSEVFDLFFAALGDEALSGMPVLLALDSGRRTSRRCYAGAWPACTPTPCLRSSSPTPPTGRPRLTATRHGCAPASTEPPPNSPWRCARTGSDRQHLLRIRSRGTVIAGTSNSKHIGSQ